MEGDKMKRKNKIIFLIKEYWRIIVIVVVVLFIYYLMTLK